MKKAVAGAALFICFFTLVAHFAVGRAARDTREARVALNEFFERVQAGDYRQAQRLLSSRFGAYEDVAALKKNWQTFDEEHGTLRHWVPAHTGMVGGSAVSIVPRYVDFSYIAQGRKGSYAIVIARMMPEQNGWRVEKLNIVP